MYVWCVSEVFLFKQKTAYEVRIRGWSSDVCSSDLRFGLSAFRKSEPGSGSDRSRLFYDQMVFPGLSGGHPDRLLVFAETNRARSEEHTSELQSLMRISYAVFCLKKKKHSFNYICQFYSSSDITHNSTTLNLTIEYT